MLALYTQYFYWVLWKQKITGIFTWVGFKPATIVYYNCQPLSNFAWYTGLPGPILHGGNKAIASMPPGHCLCAPLKCSSRNLQFPHRVPFTEEKMPWCPCPFKNEALHVGYHGTMTSGCQNDRWSSLPQRWTRFDVYRQTGVWNGTLREKYPSNYTFWTPVM